MPSQEFKEAVENQDVRRVRIMLGDRIIIDPTFQTFYNDLNYAKKELGENLFEPYDHKLTNENIKNWTEKSIAREIIRLNNNFSRERINLLYKMCQTVYSDRIQSNKEKNISHAQPKAKFSFVNWKQKYLK